MLIKNTQKTFWVPQLPDPCLEEGHAGDEPREYEDRDEAHGAGLPLVRAHLCAHIQEPRK